jgi:SRSO17 transposase
MIRGGSMEALKAGVEPLVDLKRFLEPFGELVRRSESRRAMERYATGLISGANRKNASELGRSLPGTSGQRLQELLTRTTWEPWAMDHLRIKHMCKFASVGHGALIVDDTGFAKKGKRSVGVARQYSGTLGRVDNCQVLVTTHYVDRVFDWPVAARLYVPKSWSEDQERCRKARVPESIAFATKGEIALDLIDHAMQAGVPFRAVVVDAGYGDQPVLLDGLVRRTMAHVAGVSRTTHFRFKQWVDVDPGDSEPAPYKGKGRPPKTLSLEERIPSKKAEEIIAALPFEAWQCVAWRQGSRGPMVKEFARTRVYRTGLRGKHIPVDGWLLAERPIGKPEDLDQRKYYFAWQLDHLTLDELVDLTHVRWVIERFYQDSKGELGLDHYEGRLWTGFHRHVALVMLAHSYLTLRQTYEPEAIAPPMMEPHIPGEPDRPPPPARGFPPEGKKKYGRPAQGCC